MTTTEKEIAVSRLLEKFSPEQLATGMVEAHMALHHKVIECEANSQLCHSLAQKLQKLQEEKA